MSATKSSTPESAPNTPSATSIFASRLAVLIVGVTATTALLTSRGSWTLTSTWIGLILLVILFSFSTWTEEEYRHPRLTLAFSVVWGLCTVPVLGLLLNWLATQPAPDVLINVPQAGYRFTWDDGGAAIIIIASAIVCYGVRRYQVRRWWKRDSETREQANHPPVAGEPAHAAPAIGE